MRVNLTDRVIAITGASSGLGAATAVWAARAGMDVALAARRVDRLEHVAGQITALGRRAIVIPCDVDRDADVRNLVEQTVSQLGHLDVMFANAGYGIFASVLETTEARMRAIFETNFYGTLRCIWSAAPVMIQQTPRPDTPEYRGQIIIMSSAASEVGPPMYGAYAATKAAQDSIASAMRAELRDQGIMVTSIHPIGTATEFSQRVEESTDSPLVKPNTPDLFRQSADHVARCTIKAMRHPTRAEVWPSFWTRMGVGLSTAFPALPAWGLRRHMRNLQAKARNQRTRT